jgi:5-methylthioadenosine/S-adenosylhomocysteine deaminase
VHATQLEASDIASLAAGAASVVHCPRSNMKLASGACPVAELRRSGVNVALGTDGAASNNRLDLWSELQAAALLANHVAHDATALPAAAALEMATINGARALALEHEIGSIAVEKAADLVCVRLDDLVHQPLFDPLAALVYSASRADVTDVWVAGQHLVAGGEHTRLDPAALSAAAQQWSERLLQA